MTTDIAKNKDMVAKFRECIAPVRYTNPLAVGIVFSASYDWRFGNDVSPTLDGGPMDSCVVAMMA